MCRPQVRQFHRRFDEQQSYHVRTNPVELRSVWSVSRCCTQWKNCLCLLSRLSTTVQIRHRSVTNTEWPLDRLWSWSTCKRYVECRTSIFYTVSTKKLYPCIRCHNSAKQRWILRKFYANTETLNCKQGEKFQQNRSTPATATAEVTQKHTCKCPQ